MAVEYALSSAVSNDELDALFGAGWPGRRDAPEAGGWQPVLERSLAYVTVRDEGRLVGFVNVAWDGRVHAFLLDTCVHPDYRRRGIGVELVRRASRAARDAGCVWLHVDFEPDLKPFYEACGFTQTDAAVLRLR